MYLFQKKRAPAKEYGVRALTKAVLDMGCQDGWIDFPLQNDQKWSDT